MSNPTQQETQVTRENGRIPEKFVEAQCWKDLRSSSCSSCCPRHNQFCQCHSWWMLLQSLLKDLHRPQLSQAVLCMIMVGGLSSPTPHNSWFESLLHLISFLCGILWPLSYLQLVPIRFLKECSTSAQVPSVISKPGLLCALLYTPW